LTYAKIESFGI